MFDKNLVEEQEVVEMTEEERLAEIDSIMNQFLVVPNGFVLDINRSEGLLGSRKVKWKGKGSAYVSIYSIQDLSTRGTYKHYTKGNFKHSIRVNEDNLSYNNIDKRFKFKDIDLFNFAIAYIVKNNLRPNQKDFLEGKLEDKLSKYNAQWKRKLKYEYRIRIEKKAMKLLLGNKDIIFYKRLPYDFKVITMAQMFKQVTATNMMKLHKYSILFSNDEFFNNILYTDISIDARKDFIDCYKNNKLIKKSTLQEISDVLQLKGAKAQENINSHIKTKE